MIDAFEQMEPAIKFIDYFRIDKDTHRHHPALKQLSTSTVLPHNTARSIFKTNRILTKASNSTVSGEAIGNGLLNLVIIQIIVAENAIGNIDNFVKELLDCHVHAHGNP